MMEESSSIKIVAFVMISRLCDAIRSVLAIWIATGYIPASSPLSHGQVKVF